MVVRFDSFQKSVRLLRVHRMTFIWVAVKELKLLARLSY